MPKILLVEDDNNLREIYEARLQAEGYTIVSAHDGEEALVVAKAEKPDLIISDVMMPKISGFEMLDILRNTDSLRGVKVIMLTALGQSDDQQRATKLGADRYLVKSQVTLEDIVNEANGLLNVGTKPVDATMPSLNNATPQAAATPAATTPTAPDPLAAPSTLPPTVGSLNIPPPPDLSVPSAPAPTVTAIPVTTPPPEPVAATPPVSAALAEPEKKEESEVESQINNFADNGESTTPGYSSSQPTGKKVIQPIPDTEDKPTLNELLEKEKAKEIVSSTPTPSADAAPTMSAADTAPAPTNSIISPGTTGAVDPNSVAL